MPKVHEVNTRKWKRPAATGIFMVWAAMVVMGLSACGYKLKTSGLLPGNTRSVSVHVFRNKSTYSGAQSQFTNALIREILLSTQTRVADPGKASVVIDGSIDSLTFSGLSRTSSDEVLERRVTAVVSLTMKDNDGQVVWQLRRFRGVEEATVSSENASDEASKKEAIETAFAKMAQKIVSQMLDDF